MALDVTELSDRTDLFAFRVSSRAACSVLVVCEDSKHVCFTSFDCGASLKGPASRWAHR